MSSLEQPIKIFDNFVSGDYSMGSSETHVLPIIINTRLDFTIIHNANRPDHTPRFWLSKVPRSLSVGWGGRPDFFNIKNVPYRVSIIASTDKKLYSNLYTFLVTTGKWYINIQNLENHVNGYRINIL